MARLRMSVSRSGLELTEVRCSFRPGAQGTQSCNYGRRRGLLRANGEDVARILIREGLAHPYAAALGVRNEKHGAIEANPRASHRDARRTPGRSALQRRAISKPRRRGSRPKARTGETTIEPVAADPRPDRVERSTSTASPRVRQACA
jgi:hypothetical protein